MKASIISINEMGTFRTATGKTKTQWPLILINDRDKIVHSIARNPILHPSRLVRTNNWTQLLEIDPPELQQGDSKSILLCEEDSFYPISPACPTIDSEEAEKAHQRETYLERMVLSQEAKQRAKNRASEKDAQAQLMTQAMMVILGVIVMATLLLGFVVVQKTWRSGDSKTPPSATGGRLPSQSPNQIGGK